MASKRLYKTLKQLLREITKLPQAPIVQKLVQQLVALLNSLGRNLRLSRRMRRALKQFIRLTTTLRHTISRQTFYWSLRANLVTRNPQAGFVLPTVTLLLLVTSLVVGMLVFRSFNRTAQVIGNRQQQVLFNAATPAIDRAKAKLEYLFRQDNLPPLPSDADILSKLGTSATGTYTLPDETRLDLNGDGTLDNAWSYQFNSDGRTPQTVVYSILTRSSNCPNNAATCSAADRVGITNNSDQAKARAFVVRNGPINVTGGGGNPNCPDPSISPSAAWLAVQGSALRKALQIDAYVRNNETGATTTLEFQQDRQTNQGNKWGAWFRYDLEIFPGPRFHWNGAMYTSGNLIAQRNTTGLALYPISSPFSCVYSADASEVVINQTDLNRDGDSNDAGEFQGQILVGQVGNNEFAQDFRVFPVNPPYNSPTTLNSNNHSVTTGTPSNHLIDPVLLYTEDREQTRNTSNLNNTANRRATWNKPTAFNLVRSNRVYNNNYPKPFVDDTYRADNRWGPKPTYGLDNSIRLVTNLPAPAADPNTRPAGTVRNGDLITASNTAGTELEQLTRNTPPPEDEATFGLDGYWERRAIRQGVRFIVGQRLELGNANGWNYRGQPGHPGTFGTDPLYPPPNDAAANSSMAGTPSRTHEQRQMRTLRDNLAAVQATAVYHYQTENGAFPVACLATTAHPGTAQSILNSVTFAPAPGLTGVSNLNTNFFQGIGTNGWEFRPPGSTSTTTISTDTGFGSALGSAASPTALRVALTNLARFAGDLQVDASGNITATGAFPPTQESSGTIIHPYPLLSMWGNFSELRRVIKRLDDGVAYSDLSPAEKTYLHTAACTMGMLAHNIRVAQASYDASFSGVNVSNLGVHLTQLIQSNPNTGNPIIGRPNTGPNAGRNICTSFSPAGNPPINPPFTGSPFSSNGCPYMNPFDPNLSPDDSRHYRNYFAQFTPQEWLNGLQNSPGNPNDGINVLTAILRPSAFSALQIARDRALGFSDPPGGWSPSTPAYDPTTGTYTIPSSGSGSLTADDFAPGQRWKMACDPNTFFDTITTVAPPNSDRAKFGLALILCQVGNLKPKYPSLFYLFPKANHSHNGTYSASATDIRNAKLPDQAQATQPSGEPYIADTTYIATTGVNAPSSGANEWYRVVGSSDGIEDTSAENPGVIALPPRPTANWVLPSTTTQTNRVNGIIDNSDGGTATATNRYTALLDKGIFNGRERMAVRVLDIDLDLLRRNTAPGGDYWLPLPSNTALGLPAGTPPATGALLYGFREDAVREDGIARPRSVSPDYTTWLSNWQTWATATTSAGLSGVTGYTMNAVGSPPNDPPLNPNSNISAKPVDFYADPDRRPYGFRLRNGADLRRVGAAATEARGMSFISDNPVYIQGDFNLHSTDGTPASRIEEFTQTLNQTPASLWDNFYTRNSLNTNFARASTDSWRSTEIIADAITILSNAFQDGAIANGIRNANSTIQYNGQPVVQGSFTGFLEPNATNVNQLVWVREDGSASNSVDAAVPIKISQRGFPVYCVQPNGTNSSPVTSPATCASAGNAEVEYGRESQGINATLARASSISSITINSNNNRTFREPGTSSTNRLEPSGTATETTVNAVIVSGLVPSRQNQSYGGMHNFPRFIEDWRNVNLNIAGSLYQLNFSTYATAPFDQNWNASGNAWEPGQAAFNAQTISYYDAPNRRWGFDPALQYSPAGIVARRFSTPSTIRSEFYRELPVDDPYIVNLRCARVGGNRVDPTVSGCPS